MKKTAFILIVFIFLKPLFPVLDYAVNYEYISKVLCVNKAKPMMHCNGKCHLMKELAKAAETENPKSSDKKSFSPIQEVLFFNEIGSYKIVYCGCSKQPKNRAAYLDFYSYLKTNSVFHPPTILS